MQSDKDQLATRARPALVQRLSRLLHLRRSSWAGSASAEEKGTSAASSIAGTATTATPAPQAGPTSAPPKETTAAAASTTATNTGERVPKPIVDTPLVDMAPQTSPKVPTLPIALPDDPRVEHRFAQLNGVRYHYLYAEPSGGKWRATVFLVSLGRGL
jgi:hypothetical protein